MTDDGISREQNKSFWASLPPTVEAPALLKRRKSIKQIMADCPRCGVVAVRRMAMQPEFTHEGRAGRRLAHIYGINYQRWEDLTAGEQDALGRREQKRREKK